MASDPTTVTALGSPTDWISFTDAENTTWLFDVTFLGSGWNCAFGSGCPGTEPGDNGARGCCAHGAYLVDDEEREHVAAAATHLDPSIWENHDLVATDDDLFDRVDEDTLTRSVDDACIFLNSPDFAGGHGCALHIGALRADEAPMTWKPTVCWQVPFRLEEYEDGSGTRTVAVRAWRRSDWGEGGDDFAYWCTEELPEAVEGSRTWQVHQDELRALVGDAPIDRLVEELVARGHQAPQETAVTLDRIGR
ncbi:MAG: hypothetical protein AAF567_07805 [Actinomycetota bacterium]